MTKNSNPECITRNEKINAEDLRQFFRALCYATGKTGITIEEGAKILEGNRANDVRLEKGN